MIDPLGDKLLHWSDLCFSSFVFYAALTFKLGHKAVAFYRLPPFYVFICCIKESQTLHLQINYLRIPLISLILALYLWLLVK